MILLNIILNSPCCKKILHIMYVTFTLINVIGLNLNPLVFFSKLQVATHETSHLFGLNHCVFFECSMNESKSISQALSQPFFLCPICLRKLQRFLKFDVKERYKGLFEVCRTLQEFYPSPGMERTCQWLERCMTFLNTENGSWKMLSMPWRVTVILSYQLSL